MKSIREYFEEVETTKEYDTEFEEKGKKTSEWHYYISSRKVSARDLLYPARMEWSVEFMHWLPDVHFGEGFATPRIEMFRKISISSENSPYPLSNRLKYKPPPNTPFPTSCLTAFLSLTLLSLFGVKIGFREFPAGGIPTTKERIYIYPKPENRRRSRAAPPEAFSGEVFNFYVLYKIYRYTSVKSNDFAKNICKCGAIFKKRRDL